MVNDHIGVIILAAGQSTRFGTSKMSYKLNNYGTILQNTINQYLMVFSNVTVVINDCLVIDEALKTLGVNLVVNENPEQGMSQSLRLGIQSQTRARSWLIALGDMPYVSLTSLKKISTYSEPESIVVPSYKKRQGHPVLFGSDFKSQLLSLKGDVGAKSVIKENRSKVIHINLEDHGLVHDIDSVDDILLN